MKTKIYALLSDNGDIRYIGKTIKSLSIRFSGHLYEVRYGENNYKVNWIRSILKRGRLPSIVLIGEVDGTGSCEERAWIKYFRDEGVRLVNATDGGEGTLGHKCSDKTRKQMSISRKGRIPWNKGKPCPEKTRLKISVARLGVPSPLKGKPGKSPSEITRRKLSEIGKLRRDNDDTKLRRSESLKNYWGSDKSDAHRIRVSKFNRDKVVSDVYRENMRIAQKRKFSKSSCRDEFGKFIKENQLYEIKSV